MFHSVVEAIAKFDVDFARVVPVISAEDEARVIFAAAVGDIQCGEGCGKTFAEILADREIESCVLRQIIAWVGRAGESIAEAGTVVDVGGDIRVPRESDVTAYVERVALVVIEWSQGGR